MLALVMSGSLLLLIPLGLAILVYGGFPLLIYLTFKNEAHPTLQPFIPSDQTLPLLVREHFRKACDDLMPLGFEYIAGMRLPQMTDNVMAIMILLANRSAGDVAGAVSIYSKSDEVWDLQTSYVEYSTSFQSGLTINTQNSTAISSFPPVEECENYRFPTVRDHAQLFRVHEALLSRHHGSTKVMRLDQEFHGDAVAFVCSVLNREMVSAAADGYLYLSADKKHYRATIKGALLMTWQELFPFKQIRRAARDRLALRQLADLSLPKS